jgi:HEAT repeat protein
VARSLLILIAAITLAATSFSQISTEWQQTETRINTLLSGNTEQKRTALAEIRNLRSEQASRLAIPALSDQDEIVRATAASSVIFLPEAEAARVLLPLLDDKRPFVRREAAYALGQVGNWSATNRLRRVMSGDRDLEVRAAAAAAIGNIGDHSALGDLLAVLTRRPDEDEEFLRRSAARAIGQIFELRFTGSTETLTPQNHLPARYKDLGPGQPVNPPIIDAAAADRIAAVLSTVIRSTREADDTRREAAFALGAMRRPENAPLLRTLLSNSDPYLAEIDKEALLKVGEKE